YFDATKSLRQPIGRLNLSDVSAVHEDPARHVDRGIGIEKESADNTGIVLDNRVARVGRPIRLLGDKRSMKREVLPCNTNLGRQTAIEHSQTLRIGQQI